MKRSLLEQPLKRTRTPTRLSKEAVECGAVSLGIILAYYDRIVPATELRDECGVSRDGSNAANILKAASSYGTIAKGYKKELEELPQIEPPYIVHWSHNHFLVVEGFGKKRVYLNDPASGRRTVSIDEFDRSFTGVVLIIRPGPEFEKGGKKRNIFAALASRLNSSKSAIIFCLFAGLLLVVPRITLPVFTQVFVDRILIAGSQDWLRPLLLGIIVTVIIRVLLTLIQLKALRRLLVKLSVSMSGQFFWHLLNLPVEFYARRSPGEISSRAALNDRVAEILSGRLATTIIDAMMMGFYAIIMFAYDRTLTSIAVIFAASNFLALYLLSRSRIDANISVVQEYGKVSSVAVGGIKSIETVKASGIESDLFTKFAGYYTKAINAKQKLDLQTQILAILPEFLTALATASILFIGGWRAIAGQISIGMLIAYQLLAENFFKPVNNLVNFGSTLQELEADLDRLDDVLKNHVDSNLEDKQTNSPPYNRNGFNQTSTRNSQINTFSPSQKRSEVRGRRSRVANIKLIPGINNPETNKNIKPLTSDLLGRSPLTSDLKKPPPAPISFRLQGYIELVNLTFGYSPLEAPLIKNFNLTVKPGQRIALVGSTGSGKSTIAKLICGLYNPWEGEILFDGKKIKDIPRAIFANSLANVEQDIFLFAGTVRENLTLWDTTIPKTDLIDAAKDALIDEDIKSLRGGYNAFLNEGGTILSGGQRQRLEIARALAKNPAILILDEATSALDAETEQKIDRNLRRRGITCIVVAHRLSTIRDCDEIIVLEKGKVVQRGTHDELKQQKGKYSNLINND